MVISGEGKVVCVTGGSCFIASWLIKLLLDQGYTVKATVTDLKNPKKTEHLRALCGAKERLHLFGANLIEEGAFDPVVDGCEGVFHVASPVYLSVIDPQDPIKGACSPSGSRSIPKARTRNHWSRGRSSCTTPTNHTLVLLEPAVKGTLNVLKSCAKVPSIKRVVVTSSMAAIVVNGKPLTHGVVVDETWCSDPAFCEENKLWYALSKTLADDAARKFAKENRIDLVTIHPGWVVGPPLQPTLNLTVEIILNHIKGQTFPNENFRFVDVRDVANAHILAFERPEASGRYCLVGRVSHFSEFLKIVCEQYPRLCLPEKCCDGKPFVTKYEVSKEKMRNLGLNFIPLEVTTRDTIECLKDKGFLHF